MAWLSTLALLTRPVKYINKYVFFPLFSLGKIIASGLQTALGLTYSLNYCRHQNTLPEASPYQNADTLTLTLNGIALASSFEITTVTRVLALKNMMTADLPSENQSFSRADFYSQHRLIYGLCFSLATVSSLGSSLNTAINGWLFGRSLIELGFKLNGIEPQDPAWKDLIDDLGLASAVYESSSVSASTFSYTVPKIQKNAKILALKIINNDWDWRQLSQLEKSRVVKTVVFTILSLMNTGAYNYFASKNSVRRFYADLAHQSVLANSTCISWASILTLSALATELLTSTPSLYKWMARDNNTFNHASDNSSRFIILRILTLYFFGILDSAFAGLGSFRGAAELGHDLFGWKHYSFSLMLLGTIAALIGAIKNKVFYVDEGFVDYRDLRIRRIESLRRLRGSGVQAEGGANHDLEMQPFLEDPDSDDEPLENTQPSIASEYAEINFPYLNEEKTEEHRGQVLNPGSPPDLSPQHLLTTAKNACFFPPPHSTVVHISPYTVNKQKNTP